MFAFWCISYSPKGFGIVHKCYIITWKIELNKPAVFAIPGLGHRGCYWGHLLLSTEKGYMKNERGIYG